MIALLRAAAALALCASLLAACAGDDGEGIGPDGSRRMKDGETLGRIDRLPGGTPVPVETRVFRSATCANGILTIDTSAETIAGGMECSRMLQQIIVAAFYGKDVAVSFTPGRLIVESPEAGTMEFPVDKALLREHNATP